jgi:hypothetical protein
MKRTDALRSLHQTPDADLTSHRLAGVGRSISTDGATKRRRRTALLMLTELAV